MPQFDFVSFFVQIFWFLLTAFAFYLLSLIYFSKNIGQLMKVRSKIQEFTAVMKDKIKTSDLYDQVLKSARHK